MPPDNKLFDQLKYIIKIDKFGNKFFYNTAQLLHREDGPAIEYTNGTKCWYRNGLCHVKAGRQLNIQMVVVIGIWTVCHYTKGTTAK